MAPDVVKFEPMAQDRGQKHAKDAENPQAVQGKCPSAGVEVGGVGSFGASELVGPAAGPGPQPVDAVKQRRSEGSREREVGKKSPGKGPKRVFSDVVH